MSIKKSEQFSYFQNKAHHYDNIRNIKSVIDQKHTKPMRHTLDVASSKHRKVTSHLKQYEIRQQNSYMMDRLFNIMNSRKSPINKLDSYSRFQKFQREFKKKSPHRDEVHRSIDIENKIYNSKIDRVKPWVGSVDQWKDQYGDHVSHRKNVRRYLENGDNSDQEKGQLELSRDNFVPKEYLNFFPQDADDQSTPAKKVLIKNSKLLELPHLPNARSSRIKIPENPMDTITLRQ